MGLLDKKKSKIFKTVEPPKIRVEKVPIERKPSSSSRPRHPSRPGSNRASSSPSPSLSGTSSSAAAALSSVARKRKALASRPAAAARRGTPDRRVEFGRESSESEDDGDWAQRLDAKRQKRGRLSDGTYVDPDRALRHRGAFDEGTPAAEGMIHAADVASLRHRCEPVLGAREDEVAVELQYPSLQPRERYELVWGKDMIDAVGSIISVVRHVADFYLTEDQARPFTDHTKGLARRLEKASNPKVNDLAAFKAALAEYNDATLALVRDGTVARNLDRRHELPRAFVQFLLSQVYDRTVAPRVELLSKYENGSDNVYGELLHPFVSKILIEQLQMTSAQVFVDLGSGVGNVVLQAALEIGCESWGCEMMDNACNLADAQEKEFAARCLLWGLAPGKVRLERGDFRKSEPIQEALKRADVVLVNNQAFTSQLNDDLVRMFLDLKSGCKIVSLKTFVHDHKSASNDVGRTILDVEQLTYPEGYVSWTNAGGTYCISTRK